MCMKGLPRAKSEMEQNLLSHFLKEGIIFAFWYILSLRVSLTEIELESEGLDHSFIQTSDQLLSAKHCSGRLWHSSEQD